MKKDVIQSAGTKLEKLTKTMSARRFGGAHQAGRGRTRVEEGIRALRPNDGARACLLPVLACAPALRKYLKSASTSGEFKMHLIIRASLKPPHQRSAANHTKIEGSDSLNVSIQFIKPWDIRVCTYISVIKMPRAHTLATNRRL